MFLKSAQYVPHDNLSYPISFILSSTISFVIFSFVSLPFFSPFIPFGYFEYSSRFFHCFAWLFRRSFSSIWGALSHCSCTSSNKLHYYGTVQKIYFYIREVTSFISVSVIFLCYLIMLSNNSPFFNYLRLTMFQWNFDMDPLTAYVSPPLNRAL